MESFPFHTVTLVLDIIYFVGFCGMLVFVVFAKMMGGMSHGSNINENERMVKERMAIYIFAIVGKIVGFFLPWIYPYYFYDIAFKVIFNLLCIVFCMRVKIDKDTLERTVESIELSYTILTALRIAEFLYVIN